jgi:hypothetical protein
MQISTKDPLMVEVFKTNVQEVGHSEKMVRKLLEHFPESRINFDLDDCDKILRVEGEHVLPEKIIEILGSNGYQCDALE